MANPTSAEILSRLNEPEHESQEYFSRGRHGRALATCVNNGYTYTGVPLGSQEHTGRQRSARTETAMQSLHAWIQETHWK